MQIGGKVDTAMEKRECSLYLMSRKLAKNRTTCVEINNAITKFITFTVYFLTPNVPSVLCCITG